MEIASDLALLALFDTILYVDDSGSMAFEQDGERIDDLKLILNRVAFATSLFDQDGIQGQYKVRRTTHMLKRRRSSPVRFMNSQVNGDNVTSQQQAEQLVQRVRFSGLVSLAPICPFYSLKCLAIIDATRNSNGSEDPSAARPGTRSC